MVVGDARKYQVVRGVVFRHADAAPFTLCWPICWPPEVSAGEKVSLNASVPLVDVLLTLTNRATMVVRWPTTCVSPRTFIRIRLSHPTTKMTRKETEMTGRRHTCGG